MIKNLFKSFSFEEDWRNFSAETNISETKSWIFMWSEYSFVSHDYRYRTMTTDDVFDSISVDPVDRYFLMINKKYWALLSIKFSSTWSKLWLSKILLSVLAAILFTNFKASIKKFSFLTKNLIFYPYFNRNVVYLAGAIRVTHLPSKSTHYTWTNISVE